MDKKRIKEINNMLDTCEKGKKVWTELAEKTNDQDLKPIFKLTAMLFENIEDNIKASTMLEIMKEVR